jgi:hypothetical protein
MKSIFILLSIFVLFSCQKQQDRAELDKIRNVIAEGKDTIIKDESGNPLIVNFNERLEHIESSLNGNVFYSYSLNQDELTYDKHGNVLKTVYKTDYMNKNFKVYVNDDTLNIGETFSAVVWTSKEKYVIDLDEPKKEIVKRDVITDFYTFEQACLKEGVFKFKGKIVYDSGQIFPFEYKYLVK